MTGAHYVHGGTDAREIARLEKQARFFAPFTFPHITLPPGARLLDLATGVGAVGALLQARFDDRTVVGVDLSAAQLTASRANHPELSVIRADATALPFADGTFERVHWSWLLEHVPEPVAVLREVRRVLAPNGSAHFIEVDNATFSTDPPIPEALELMRRLGHAQAHAGGDALVGQKLPALLRAAGFERFSVVPTPLLGSADDPAFFEAMVEEFAEIFEGLDESVGREAPELPTRAATALRALPSHSGARFSYTPVITHAER